MSGRSKRGGNGKGGYSHTVACQYIVSPHCQTGTRTVTQMRHPTPLLKHDRISRDNRLPVLRRTQEGCGGLGGANFQQPFSLPENGQTLAGIAFRAAGKSPNNFPAASKFARKLFQQGISDSHSLLEFSEVQCRRVALQRHGVVILVAKQMSLSLVCLPLL